MNTSAIWHTCRDNQCFMLDENTLLIRICTGEDIQDVTLHYDDPMIAQGFGTPYKWVGKTAGASQIRKTQRHIWWQFCVYPEYKRCAYFFQLTDGQETLYLLEDMLYTPQELKLKGHKLPVFDFAWMNPADLQEAPKWVNAACWYQIFPDRFCNGNQQLPKPVLAPWNKVNPDHRDYYGGDLEGIIKKLPYLKSLGITGIYLTPVFEGKSSHKYDTCDYYKVDPAFGDTHSLQILCSAAHGLGIRIMLDAVFNHCGRFFPQWEDVIEKGPASQWWDWFMVNQWPFDKNDYLTVDKKFYSFHFSAFMPKLNTNLAAVRDCIGEICEYWIETCDIDGLRFDVADEVSHQLFKELRVRLKKKKKELFLLGEIWHDSMPWLRGDELDSVMNYPLREAVLRFYEGNGDIGVLCRELNHSYLQYMEQTEGVLFNMLDSHDTPRLITLLHNDRDLFYQALALLFALPGTPCIFYGTELAMEGGPDPDCRRSMPWEAIEQGDFLESQRMIQALTCLRAQNPCFTHGGFQLNIPEGNSHVCQVKRILHGAAQYFVMNTRAVPYLLPEHKNKLLAWKTDEQFVYEKGFCFYEG